MGNEHAMAPRANGEGTSGIEKSLDRLEAAVALLLDSLARQNQRVGAAREHLANELKEVRASHAILQDEARAVSSRLDTAIGRLRSAMET
jgi:predicted  nucleic acid-binding Zn-ribbon protein